MTAATPVLEALDAYTGHWRSERKTNGQGAAFHFEYALEWMDEGETVAELLITQVMPDGSTNVVFEGVKGREPDGSGVYYWAVSPSGRASRGEVFVDGDRLITLYDGWTADGSVVRIRDVFMPVEGDAFTSRTYLRPSPEAEWRRIGEDRWRRSEPAAVAGSDRGAAEAGSASGKRRPVLDAMAELSATTAPGGGGPDAYAALLAEGFMRWTAGDSTAMDKAAWVEGVRGWWGEGWRVADRQVRALDIEVRGRHAFVRRVVREEYVGPDGERTGPGTPVALTEVWERGRGGWRLLRVTAFPLADG